MDHHTPNPWASEGGSRPPWNLKISGTKVVFLVSRGKNRISPLLAPLEKFLEKAASDPPEKNYSDAHDQTYSGTFPSFTLLLLLLTSALVKLCSLALSFNTAC